MGDVVRSIDANTKYQSEKIKYPYIYIEYVCDPLALIIDAMEKGDVPLVVEQDGVTLSLGNYSSSPLELKKLLGVSPIRIYTEKDVYHRIVNVNELLELGVWMV